MERSFVSNHSEIAAGTFCLEKEYDNVVPYRKNGPRDLEVI